MFLDNDNTTEYFKIIEESKTINHQRVKKDFSYEDHHIIPRSIGGVNVKENRVILTLENHYICHSLLIDMVEGNDRFKMLHAWSLMNSTRDVDGFILIGPDRYASFKRELSGLLSKKYYRAGNPNSQIVYQLDLEGNFIQKWDCIKNATDKYGGDISACIREDQKTASGFLWIREEDYTEEKINELKNPVDRRVGSNSSKARRICKINRDTGTKEKCWGSLAEASKETSINLGSISNCANGYMKSAGGYVWLFEEDCILKKLRQIKNTQYGGGGKNCHMSKIVYRLGEDNNILEIFVSVTEAKKKYSGDIGACVRGRTKTAGGERWCLEENYIKSKGEQND